MKNGIEIVNGKIVLDKVEKKIMCRQCRKIIALKNRNTLLYKGMVAHVQDSALVRCDRCKTYNVIRLNDKKEEKK